MSQDVDTRVLTLLNLELYYDTGSRMLKFVSLSTSSRNWKKSVAEIKSIDPCPGVSSIGEEERELEGYPNSLRSEKIKKNPTSAMLLTNADIVILYPAWKSRSEHRNFDKVKFWFSWNDGDDHQSHAWVSGLRLIHVIPSKWTAMRAY